MTTTDKPSAGELADVQSQIDEARTNPAMFMLKELRAAGSWDIRTLNRAIELLESIQRPTEPVMKPLEPLLPGETRSEYLARVDLKPAPPPPVAERGGGGGQVVSKVAIAAALVRKLCQLFDNGGESQRSVRSRHASAVFQILNDDAPEFIAEQTKCDRDPVGYLQAAEACALSSTARTPTPETGDGSETIGGGK